MPDDYMTDYPDVGPECGHPGSLAYPAGCKDCQIAELRRQLADAKSNYAKGRKCGLESARRACQSVRLRYAGQPVQDACIEAIQRLIEFNAIVHALIPQRGDAAGE